MDTTKLTVRQGEIGTIHPEVEKISGLIPADVDARAEYRAHILEKSFGSTSDAPLESGEQGSNEVREPLR
jgi:hypothetical protein